MTSRLRVVVFAVLCVTFAGCAGGGAPAGHGVTVIDDPPSPSVDGLSLLSRYPQSPALTSTRDTYAAAAFPSRGRDSVFMTTWFPGPDARVGEWSTIDSSGRVTLYRFVYDVGFQDSRTTSLVPSQLPELESMLPTLPASSPPATIDHLLIVGFRQPGGWVTRLYDRNAPPEMVRRIFNEMTGASLGTR